MPYKAFNRRQMVRRLTLLRSAILDEANRHGADIQRYRVIYDDITLEYNREANRRRNEKSPPPLSWERIYRMSIGWGRNGNGEEVPPAGQNPMVSAIPYGADLAALAEGLAAAVSAEMALR